MFSVHPMHEYFFIHIKYPVKEFRYYNSDGSTGTEKTSVWVLSFQFIAGITFWWAVTVRFTDRQTWEFLSLQPADI